MFLLCVSGFGYKFEHFNVSWGSKETRRALFSLGRFRLSSGVFQVWNRVCIVLEYWREVGLHCPRCSNARLPFPACGPCSKWRRGRGTKKARARGGKRGPEQRRIYEWGGSSPARGRAPELCWSVVLLLGSANLKPLYQCFGGKIKMHRRGELARVASHREHCILTFC